jgi:hypothetical protein
MRLKGRGRVDTLCHGEVAEWLNAAVSKTVTSVTPASGVRIPPSPRFGASQHFSTPPFRRLVSISASCRMDALAPEKETLLVTNAQPT